MLIELDNDLQPLLTNAADNPLLRASLSNLALAFREGNHAVTGSHRILEVLQVHPLLSEDDRGSYRQMHLRIQDSQALKTRLGCRVVVHSKEQMWRDGNGGPFHVPYTFFVRSARVQPTVLLSEHQDDARVYRCAAESLAEWTGFPPIVALQVEEIGGGGSSIQEHLRHCAAKRMVLCIVDSDRPWEGGSLGETAEKLQEVLTEVLASSVAEVHVLPVRMIENLFPRPWYLQLNVGKRNGEAILTFYKTSYTIELCGP